MTDHEYEVLSGKILRLARIDLRDYKSQQMRRRLEGFVARKQASSVTDYCHIIEEDRSKLRELLDFMAINVTEFFRDQEMFRHLIDGVLPQLLKRTTRLNIWSAGCSAGHESYSLAMAMQHRFPGRSFRILGTDLDKAALERALNGGPYSAHEVRNVSKEILESSFVPDGNAYRVTDRVRAMVQFKLHNLLADPYDTGFDLILCRNVTIYFNDEAKARVYRGFQRSLRDTGVLFIGGSEVILGGECGFVSTRPCFYQKDSMLMTACGTRRT